MKKRSSEIFVRKVRLPSNSKCSVRAEGMGKSYHGVYNLDFRDISGKTSVVAVYVIAGLFLL